MQQNCISISLLRLLRNPSEPALRTRLLQLIHHLHRILHIGCSTHHLARVFKLLHKFIDSLEIFSLLANVADVKSLVIHPATTTHGQLTDEELLDQGIRRNTIRLSIGTEHIDDILADLEKGLAAV